MYIFWVILGIAFLVLDFFKSSKLKLTLATTFLFCSIISFKFPQNYLYQLFSLASFSILFHCLITRSLKKEQEEIKKLQSLDNFIGKNAIVIKDIGKTLSIDGLGVIKFKNELYSAKSIDDKEIKAGTRVK